VLGGWEDALDGRMAGIFLLQQVLGGWGDALDGRMAGIFLLQQVLGGWGEDWGDGRECNTETSQCCVTQNKPHRFSHSPSIGPIQILFDVILLAAPLRAKTRLKLEAGMELQIFVFFTCKSPTCRRSQYFSPKLDLAALLYNT